MGLVKFEQQNGEPELQNKTSESADTTTATSKTKQNVRERWRKKGKQ
jgi:hypothetical protein